MTFENWDTEELERAVRYWEWLLAPEMKRPMLIRPHMFDSSKPSLRWLDPQRIEEYIRAVRDILTRRSHRED